MNTDELLRETFHGLEDHTNGLDPARVIAGAKRRRVRRIAATATAAATLAATVMTAFAVYPSNDTPPVAGWSATESLPVIKNRDWTQLAGGPEWFYIDGRSWKLGDPPGTKEWKGSADVLGPQATESALHPVTGGSGNYWSTLTFLPSDVARVKYVVRGQSRTFLIEANVYRLASAPEWVMAFADYQAAGPVAANGLVEVEVTVDGYNAAGDRVVRCEPPRQTSKSAPPKPACRRVR